MIYLRNNSRVHRRLAVFRAIRAGHRDPIPPSIRIHSPA